MDYAGVCPFVSGLLEEDLLAEVGNALSGRAARVRLLALALPLLSLNLPQDTLLP
jgi:hypothetical protein